MKDSDLSALKAVFGWGVANHRLSSNPATGITIKLGKPMKLRSKGFTDAEAKAILTAAWNREPGQERAKTAAAKRWVPWLCAYSGARVGEMVQLRKEDVRKEGEHWVMKITPEAGTVKTNEARDVVLHPHLVDLGFPSFVGSAAKGHLFLTPAPDGDVSGPWQGVKNRITEFVRTVVTDPNVAPLYRFHQHQKRARISPRRVFRGCSWRHCWTSCSAAAMPLLSVAGMIAAPHIAGAIGSIGLPGGQVVLSPHVGGLLIDPLGAPSMFAINTTSAMQGAFGLMGAASMASQQQRAHQRQLEEKAAREGQQLTLQYEQREKQRRDLLARQTAAQRARLGALGIASTGGSADAILTGLHNQANQEREDDRKAFAGAAAGLQSQLAPAGSRASSGLSLASSTVNLLERVTTDKPTRSAAGKDVGSAGALTPTPWFQGV